MSTTKKSSNEQSPVEQLLKDGTLTLHSDVGRKDIYEQASKLVEAIPAGTKWTRTIVEFNAGHFSQTYTIIKDK